MQYGESHKPRERENKDSRSKRLVYGQQAPGHSSKLGREDLLRISPEEKVSGKEHGKRLEQRLSLEPQPGVAETFKVKETQKIRKHYLDELMRNEVSKNGEVFRTDFLGRHRVSSEVRVRMVTSLLYLSC